jgi:hypothetical protein
MTGGSQPQNKDEISSSDSDEGVIPVRNQSPKVHNNSDKKRFDHNLYDMMSDPEMEKFICWTDDGKSIVILDTKEFEREVLKTSLFTS